MDHRSRRLRELDREPPDLGEVSKALHRAEGLDDRRLVLAQRSDTLVVGGSVASPEQAHRALLVAERFGAPVADRLRVDPAPRDAAERRLSGPG